MKKRLFAILLALTMLAGILTGCGSGSSAKSEAAYGGAYYEAPAAMAEDAAYEYEVAETTSSNAGSTTQLPQNRKWVITMDIDAETEDLDEAMAAVNAQISKLNGYVENQRVNNGSGSSRRYRNVSMTVRIPADKVDDFVQELNSCTNVLSNNRTVKDITLAYTDTEGRIKALKTEEDRLLELMAQAEDMSDLLTIERRLTEVRYDLESYSSRLRVYDNQVDYATIDLYISQVEQYTPVEKEGFLPRITKGFKQSLKDLTEGLVDFTAWLIIDLPYLVMWGLIIWGIVAAIKAGRRRKAAKSGTPKEKKPSAISKLMKKKNTEEKTEE